MGFRIPDRIDHHEEHEGHEEIAANRCVVIACPHFAKRNPGPVSKNCGDRRRIGPLRSDSVYGSSAAVIRQSFPRLKFFDNSVRVGIDRPYRLVVMA